MACSAHATNLIIDLLLMQGGIRFDKLSAGSSFERYGQSKLGNIVFSNELARRYTDSGALTDTFHTWKARR